MSQQPRPRRESGHDDDIDQPQKKKHPFGKLLEEFNPKSHRLELGFATGFLILISLACAGSAPFVPEGRMWLLMGAGLVFAAALATGYLCYSGPSTDRVQIRKLGVEFRMSGEVIRLAWGEIEYVDSHTEYTRNVQTKSTSKYQAYIGAGGKSIDLPASFLGRFEDPAGILKLIRKNTGGTLKYLELPSERDG